MDRKIRLNVLAALLACSACSGGAPDAPPDVFVIVFDTLRADRLGCYGYPRPTSPFLDGLAREGTLFADNTAQCSWTKPSMVSLFTGRYVTSYQDALPDPTPTLAESFASSGYRTIGVVGNVLLSTKAGFDKGFDHYDARELTQEERAARKEAGGSAGPCRVLSTMCAELEAQLAGVKAQRERGEHEPFFAYLHPMDTHAPYDKHEDLAEELPEDAAVPQLPSDWHRSEVERLGLKVGADPDAEWAFINRQRGRYDREMRSMDRELEALFARLEADGLLENAIVAIVADHGEELFDHLELLTPAQRRAKPLRKSLQMEHGRNLFRPLIGTPFVLWGRGVPAGRVVSEPVENVDLYPTLLQLADLRDPGDLHGRSLVPLLEGRESKAAQDVHSFVMQHTSVRERDTGLQLILPSELGKRQGGTPLLFDTKADPEQRVNLFDQRPDDVARLSEKTARWRVDFPTVTTIQRPLDPDSERNMRVLGYFGDEDEDDVPPKDE